MTRMIIIACVTIGVILLATISILPFLPERTFTVRLSADALNQHLAERLPMQASYRNLVNVELRDSQIELSEGSDRITVISSIRAGVGGGPMQLIARDGQVTISSAIRYEPSNGTFYAVDPRLEDLSIEGVFPKTSLEHAQKAMAQVQEQLFRELPVYRLDSQEVRQAVARLVLREVRVENQQLHLVLGW